MEKEKWLERWAKTFGSSIVERIEEDIEISIAKKFSVEIGIILVDSSLSDYAQWLEELGIKPNW